MSETDVKLINLGKRVFAIDFSDTEVLEIMNNLIDFELYLRKLRLKYPRKEQSVA